MRLGLIPVGRARIVVPHIVAVTMLDGKQERLLNLMLRSFRRYHLFHEFNKLNLQTNRVALVRDRDKINGAFLLLKRFKNRLKAFDEAM